MTNTELAATAELWTERVRETISRYSEPLLRQIVQRLLKPRNQWPVEELIERCVGTLTNATAIDRRLADLGPASRKLLAIVGLSRQPVWRVGHLIAILATFEHAEGLSPIQELLLSGMAHPELPEGITSLKQFEEWLGPSGVTSARLFVHPAISIRAINENLGLPAFPTRAIDSKAIRQSDGLEWLLRSAVAWQRVSTGAVRLTQQQSLFKRDLQRFQTDELLASPFTEQLTDLPDGSLFALELAIASGLIESDAYELRGRPAPELWNGKLLAALVQIWKGLVSIETWNPIHGYQYVEDGGQSPSIFLPAFLILRSVPAGEWIQAEPVAKHLFERHPSWANALNKKAETATLWIERLFLGIGYPLRFLEAVQEPSGWWFRLSDVGRHILKDEKPPNLENDFRQTLIVQPNGEMVIFRQGLTPELIGKLSRFGLWKTLGAACTMELTAESVYHGLETGLSLAEVQRLLDQHGTRAIPANVLDSLQRWASKRERITVYSSATLLEFSTSEELETAYLRGLVAVKITERIGVATGGEEIDYRHFRLIGNRDYEARPQKCITFDDDGVTFTVDAAQSDLILEAELSRIAEPIGSAPGGQRRYALTPVSLKRAQSVGYSIGELEQWAHDRSAEMLSSAARLLFVGSNGQPGLYRRRLVIELPTEQVADGVAQWPATAKFVEERLGPCALVIAETDLQALLEQLRIVGVELKAPEAT